MKTFRDVLARVRMESIEVTTEYLGLLNIAVSHFERANGAVDLSELSADHVRAMMRSMLDAGRAAVTINNNRGRVLYLWRKARSLNFHVATPPPEEERPKRVRVPKRRPIAWWPTEMEAIVGACAKMPARRSWGPAENEALLLTIYETSLRVSCLLDSEIAQLIDSRCALLVPAELQKGEADTFQPLRPDTFAKVKALNRPPGDTRLFCWPFHKREVWRHLERILILAGLPHGRRDKFHKIRRTSYSHVYAKFGREAASDHAAHKCDLSTIYLDPDFLGRPNPLDALPRP